MSDQDQEDRRKRRSDPSEIRRRLERSTKDHERVEFDPDETTDVLDVALQTVRRTLTEQQRRMGEQAREIGSAALTLTNKIPT